MTDMPDNMPSDGADVLPGTTVVPTPEEVAAVEAMTDEEKQEHIRRHIEEVDTWKEKTA